MDVHFTTAQLGNRFIDAYLCRDPRDEIERNE